MNYKTKERINIHIQTNFNININIHIKNNTLIKFDCSYIIRTFILNLTNFFVSSMNLAYF
jgi:hypothetical protein